MKNRLPRLFTMLIIVLIGVNGFSQTSFYESFDDYIAGEKFAEQATIVGDTNWLLWSNDTAEDARVSSELSLSSDNSLLIEADDDIVFYPGSYTSGRWFFSGHMNVVSGHTAYFNMMHNWDTSATANEWACQVIFNANGTGRLNVGSQDYNFTYDHDTWLYFSMEMDIDNDTAIFWINNEQIHKWPWHYQPNNTNGSNEFEAVDFYGWGDAKYYLDEVTVSTEAIIRFEDATTVWDGSSQSVTVKTYPPNISYDLTYNGSSIEPVEPGVYTVEAVITEPGYAGVATGTLTINKSQATINMVNTNIVYDGLSQSILAATSPVGLTLDIKYNGSNDLPVYTGTYLVEASIIDDYYEGEATAWLTIQKASAGISFSQTEVGYNGSGQGVIIETTPPELFITVTYNDSTDLPVDRGVYTVVATIEDMNYEGTATTNFEITEGLAVISLSDLNTEYDGTEKNVSVETDPIGLTVDLTYDGGTDIPVESGTYEVVATINDINYIGTTTQNLVINKAPAEITLNNLSHTFDETQKGVGVETMPDALTTIITYNGLTEMPVNAGSYEVVVTIDESNYTGSVTDTMLIDKAVANVSVTGLDKTYDGTEQTVNIVTTPNDLNTIVTYNGLETNPVDAGIYDVFVTIDELNYKGSETAEMEIRKAFASILISENNVVFDGSEKSANIVTEPEGLPYLITYNGLSDIPVNAGDYFINVLITDENYQGEAEADLIIQKAEANIMLTCDNVTYDGNEKPANLKTTPSEIKYTITYNEQANAPVNAGDYNVEVIITDSNYIGSATSSFTIVKAKAEIVLSDLAWEYTGDEIEPSVATNPEGLEVGILYNNLENKPVNVGEYTVSVLVNDDNYIGEASDVLKINAAAQTIFWDQEFNNLAVGDVIELDATTSSDLAVAYSISDESVAKIEGTNLIILKSGETDITASQEGDNNYLSTSVTKGVTALTNSVDSPISENIQVKCWPNPVISSLTLGIELNEPANIQVINQSGAIVLHDQVVGNNPKVDFENLSIGLYILVIEYKGVQNKIKITKR